ncbi:unnamed protein product [Owenia fusiformis]|nr:unnamed protein product [Owenia fusiformis]
MFEEENSEEEMILVDDKSPGKMKKHKTPSFKFAKREKISKKDKEDKKEKESRKEKEKEWRKEKDKESRKEKEKEGKKEKEERKKEKEGKEHKKEKLKFKKKSKMLAYSGAAAPWSTPPEAQSDAKPVFGVPLGVAVSRSKCHDGIELPAIVRETIDYIEEHGLNCEGIYRISGVKSKVNTLKEAYNTGRPAYLQEHEPNVVASLLKLYLRELPEPVLTTQLMPAFEEASTIKDPKRKVEQCKRLLGELPVANRLLVSWVIVHMDHVIQNEVSNKMTLQNVSIVLSPTMQISHRVLNVFFSFVNELFPGVEIKRNVPPLKPASSRWSLELPESPEAIEDEIKKQESLLNTLHADLGAGMSDPHKEEQLWEVQRVLTGLKRKLKNVKKQQEALEKRRKEMELKQQRAQDVLAETWKEQQLKLGLRKPSPKPKHKDPERLKDTEKRRSSEIGTIPELEVKDDANVTEVNSHSRSGSEVSAKGHSRTSSDVSKGHSRSNSDAKGHSRSGSEILGEVNTKADHSRTGSEVKIEGPPKQLKASKENIPVDINNKETEHQIEPSVEPTIDDTQIKNELTQTQELPKNTVTVEEPIQVDIEINDGVQYVEELHTPGAAESEVSSTSGAEKDSITGELFMGQGELAVSSSECASEGARVEDEESDTPGADIDTNGTDEASLEGQQQATLSLPVPISTMLEETSSAVSSDSDNDSVDEEEYQQLLHEHAVLLLEEEELINEADELKMKIETEQTEIERFQEEIAEIRSIREGLYSDESSDSSDSSEDEDDLQETLQRLKKENRELELQNADYIEKIQQERQICMDIKVQIRVIQVQQQHNVESPNGDLSESTAL